jgi:predicted oxidoreductase
LDVWETARALKQLKGRLVREVGVPTLIRLSFEALNKAMDGALVTNQIEWNPVCFEHFNSGMMDLLTVEKFTP